MEKSDKELSNREFFRKVILGKEIIYLTYLSVDEQERVISTVEDINKSIVELGKKSLMGPRDPVILYDFPEVVRKSLNNSLCMGLIHNMTFEKKIEKDSFLTMNVSFDVGFYKFSFPIMVNLGISTIEFDEPYYTIERVF